jgi:hypothetical protein
MPIMEEGIDMLFIIGIVEVVMVAAPGTGCGRAHFSHP